MQHACSWLVRSLNGPANRCRTKRLPSVNFSEAGLFFSLSPPRPRYPERPAWSRPSGLSALRGYWHALCLASAQVGRNWIPTRIRLTGKAPERQRRGPNPFCKKRSSIEEVHAHLQANRGDQRPVITLYVSSG